MYGTETRHERLDGVEMRGNIIDESVIDTDHNGESHVEPDRNTSCYTRFVVNPINSVVKHHMWGKFILTIIATNAILYAMADYTHVDENGNLVTKGSVINSVISVTDNVFFAIFAFEMIIKWLSMGLFGDNGYFSDRWNFLDFVIVIICIINFVPNVPNASIIRTIRMVRPLKSMSSSPELQSIMTSMLKSGSKLKDVLIVFTAAVIFFAIAGQNLFSGPYLHTRCRLTPYPVNTSWVPEMPAAPFQCLPGVDNFNLPDDRPGWTKESSPWRKPLDCYWPIDTDDTRFCSLGDNPSGGHICLHDSLAYGLPVEDWRWCGSNYDAYGNPRFINYKFMKSEVFIPDLDYGYTNFDNLLRASISIFQVATLNGWSNINYLLMDAWSTKISPMFFILVIVVISYLIVNLVIAIWQTNIEVKHTILHIKGGGDPIRGTDTPSHVDALDAANAQVDANILNNLLTRIRESKIIRFFLYFHLKPLQRLVNGPIFGPLVVFFIVVNTIVLLIDFYPLTSDYENRLVACNFVLTLLFGAEAACQILGVGIAEYFVSFSNLFGFFIVLISIAEIFIDPPILFFPNSKSSGFTAGPTVFRSFRLFRIISMLTRFKHLHLMCLRIGRSIKSTYAFSLILFVLAFIMALVGQALFANNLRFDSEGYPITKINSPAWVNAPDRPRSNFDDFTHAFFTVFQILTTEDWNSVMYNLWRATNLSSIIFPFFIIVFGLYIILQLFVAKIIEDFTVSGSLLIQEEELEKIKLRRREVELKEAGYDSYGFDFNFLCIRKEPPEETAQRIMRRDAQLAEDINRVNALRMEEQSEEDAGCALEQKLENRGHDIFKKAAHLVEETPPPTPPLAKKERLRGQRATPSLLVHSGSSTSLSDVMLQEEQANTRDEIGTITEGSVNSGIDDRINEERNGNSDNNANQSPDSSTLFCCCFSRTARAFVTHHSFEWFLFMAIVVSSGGMAADSPLLNPNSWRAKTCSIINLVTTIIFMAEVILKIVAWGVFGYLKDYWNLFDGFVSIVSFVGLPQVLAGTGSLNAIRSLRAFRILRPLRLLSSMPEMKVVIGTLFSCIRSALDMFIIAFFIFLVFAILMVTFFKGQLRRCTGAFADTVLANNSDYYTLLQHPKTWDLFSSAEKDMFGPNSLANLNNDAAYYNACLGKWPAQPCCMAANTFTYDPSSISSGNGIVESITSRQLCECWGGSWTWYVNTANFDNVGRAMISLFSVSTTEGFVTMAYALVDASGIDMEPIRDRQPFWLWVVMVFMILCCFLALNMFVGVIVNTYKRIAREVRAEVLGKLAQDQVVNWSRKKQAFLFMLQRRREMLKGTFFNSVANAPSYQAFNNICIFANAIVLAISYFGQPGVYNTVLDILNSVFALVFTIEAIVLMNVQRLNYFRSFQNIFDFSIVILSNVGVIIMWISGSQTVIFVGIGRLFRTLRLLRLMKAGSLDKFVKTLLRTLPELFNIAQLMFLIIFIFSIIANQSYAKIAYNNSYNAQANFRLFSTTLLTLFRFQTGEGWNQFMNDASAKTPNCVVDPPYDPAYCGFSDHPGCIPLNGCGSSSLYVFLLSFTVLVYYVITNLAIAVVNAAYMVEMTQRTFPEDDNIIRFCDGWASETYDPDMTTFIDIGRIEEFAVDRISNPYAFPDGITQEEIRTRLCNMEALVVYEGRKLFFFDVLTAFLNDWEERNGDLVQGQRENASWLEFMGGVLGITAPVNKTKGGNLSGLKALGRRGGSPSTTNRQGSFSSVPYSSPHSPGSDIDNHRSFYDGTQSDMDPALMHELMLEPPPPMDKDDFENLREFFSQSSLMFADSASSTHSHSTPIRYMGINERGCEAIDIITPAFKPISYGDIFSLFEWDGRGMHQEQQNGDVNHQQDPQNHPL